jgi:hypothetical protein
MTNSVNLFTNLLQNHATLQHSGNIYESYIKAATLFQQQKPTYDLAYRSLLQYNPAAAAACAAFYNTKKTKKDESYETVSSSLSDDEDNNKNFEQIKMDDEILEEGEITKISDIDEKPKIGKEIFEKMQKCLINDTDNAIIQCFEDDDELIKHKENIPSKNEKLSNSFKIDSLLDSTTTTTKSTPTTENFHTLKNEILLAVNLSIQKTFENFIRVNFDSTVPQQQQQSANYLKRNLVSSNTKPYKRQRLNDNPSSRTTNEAAPFQINQLTHQIYTAAISRLQNQQQQQPLVNQLFFNPTNRLFTPYLMENSGQSPSTSSSSPHIINTPTKRRRTKVTDIRVSTNQISKSSQSSILNISNDDSNDEINEESLHSTNEGLLNVYSSDNSDQMNNQPTTPNEYIGYQISFF